MTALWWLAAFVASSFVLVGVWCAGHSHGERKVNHELDREWRQMFTELGEDHGRELHQLEDELARADATIDMLRRNDGVAFLAGQMLRADREEHGL